MSHCLIMHKHRKGVRHTIIQIIKYFLHPFTESPVTALRDLPQLRKDLPQLRRDPPPLRRDLPQLRSPVTRACL